MKFENKEEFLEWYHSDDVHNYDEVDYFCHAESECWMEILEFGGKYYQLEVESYEYSDIVNYSWDHIKEVTPKERTIVEKYYE